MRHHRAGEMHLAADAWVKAAQAEPSHPETRNNLGVALQSLGRLEESRLAFVEATRLRPAYAEAWENLAGLLLLTGRTDEAVAAAREMARLIPNAAGSYVVLASTLARLGRFEEAGEACVQGLSKDSNHPDALYCLANVRAAQQRWTDAADAYAKVVGICPTLVEAHVNLGVCLASAGNLSAAADRFRETLKRDPNCAPAALRLADVLDRLGLNDEALASAARAAQLVPKDAAALNLLASLSDRARKNADAESAYKRSLKADPNFAPALSNYATLLARRGEIERAIPMLRQAVEAEPAEPVPHSSLCMYLNADPTAEPREAFAEHVRWGQRHAVSLLDPRPHGNDCSPDRKLRIGYVSPDWAGHPVARFMQPILESHDAEAFEVHVFDDAPKPDAFTERLRPLAHRWHRSRGTPDAQLAELIRQEKIDVLVDLAGHTADNRLLAFARKPAPVQVSYLGYPNTTGVGAIDYRFTDAIADPHGVADELHTETLVRLPGTFLTFRPPVETPDVSEMPLTRNGFVTFGSFNALWKINTPLLQQWARVLQASPNSRMLIKADGLDDASVAGRIAQVFESSGVSRDRLRLVGREQTYAGHLAAYGSCDVCLDGFPYAGTTTTCEALWMGAPVVSLLGQTHASRVGGSVLTSIGLGELCASTADGFVDIATNLAADPDRIREIRTNLRAMMLASRLMNPAGLTRAIEASFREVWLRWCRG
jgi:predicted O-linked N-acetylglucosamine transferase (SPINDLY family)